MIKIEIENKVYEMPSSFKELTLGKFIEVNQIFKEDEYDKNIEMVSIISGIQKDILLDLPYSEFIKLSNECDFIKNEIDKKPEYIVEIDNTKYGMQFDFSKMSTGEYLDIDHFSKGNYIDNLHILMAIIYRPILNGEGLEYEIENYTSRTLQSRANLFYEKMPAQFAISASVFFCLIGIFSLETIQVSSEKQIKSKRIKKIQKIMS